MLREAFEFLFTRGRESAESIVHPKAEPGHVYFVRHPDGDLERKVAEAPPRAHVAADLSAIVAKAQAAHKGGDAAEVWYSRAGVVLTLDAARRDRVSLPLGLSPQLAQLKHWEMTSPTPAFQQAALVKLLRTVFKDNLSQAGNLVEVLRNLKFSASVGGTSAVGHGTASIGKTLEASLTGTKALPEYVLFDVPVFAPAAFAGVRATVECALEPDPGTLTFQLIPVAGQAEAAATAGEAELGRLLREALPDLAERVFYGQP